MSTNPKEIFNHQSSSDDIKSPKEPAQAEVSSAQTHAQKSEVQESEIKKPNFNLLLFLKKHQNFLLLQCVLLILIGVSFLFW